MNIIWTPCGDRSATASMPGGWMLIAYPRSADGAIFEANWRKSFSTSPIFTAGPSNSLAEAQEAAERECAEYVLRIHEKEVTGK